jgi:hypothetical protein
MMMMLTIRAAVDAQRRARDERVQRAAAHPRGVSMA